MDADANRPAGLAAETVEERRARLMPSAEPRSRVWRRVAIALVFVLALTAGIFVGAVPGSSAVGRYPVWDLYALADRLEAKPPMSSCGPIPIDAHVDLLTGRVVVDTSYLALPDDELAMVTWVNAETRSAPAARVTRIAVGAPALCLNAIEQ